MNSNDAKRLARFAVRQQKEKAKSTLDEIARSAQSSRRLAAELARGKMLDDMSCAQRQAFLAAERQPMLTQNVEQSVRAAYLRVTGGKLNEYVKLADLRAALPTEDRATVDAELKAMQQRGEAVLYPIDDPRRLRPDDDAAALKVSGERRDLFLLRRSEP